MPRIDAPTVAEHRQRQERIILGGRVAHRQGHTAGRKPNPVLTRYLTAALLAGLAAVAAGCAAPLSPDAKTAAPHSTSSNSADRSPAATSPPPPAASSGLSAASSPRNASPNPGGLSDAQMAGQLFMTYVYGASATSATPAQRAANIALYGVPTGAQVIRRWHLGGIILIGYNNLDPARPTLASDNVDNSAQIAALTQGLQKAATHDDGPPLLIATDQEGGRVQRITSGVTPRPPQRALASTSRGALECGYFHLGQQLRALGVNQDLAPDADVVTTATGIIGDRSFGPDPGLDANDVTAAVTGLQHAGVLATLKHWPGHGSTPTDSHLHLAVVHESQPTWQRLDRVPFARAAPLAAAIMVGHLALPAIDPSGTAATFSPVLTQRLLRDQLGYRGLIISDSLWMKPARDGGTPGRVAARILTAGIDMMLEPPDLPDAYASVLHAVITRPSFRARVQDAVKHILAAKAQVTRTPSGPGAC